VSGSAQSAGETAGGAGQAATGLVSAGAAPVRRSGRRPGGADTRLAILEAARAEFAGAGYDTVTIRGIAARAKVDPALVHHYFGTKESLFGAALELPIRPREVFAEGLAAGRDRLGATVVRRFLETWEPADTRIRLVAMLRSATTNDAAMDMVRELLAREVFEPITDALGVADARLRATLVASQLIGLALLRYISRLEPLASASIDQLVVIVGPTLQRYLTGDISAADRGASGPVTSAP